MPSVRARRLGGEKHYRKGEYSGNAGVCVQVGEGFVELVSHLLVLLNSVFHMQRGGFDGVI